MKYDYDLIVLGSGPAGQRAAIQAAKLGKRAVVIEHRRVVGGVSVNTGTIPSKTFREAVLHLSGYRERGIYGSSYRVKEDITMEDLVFRVEQVIRTEIDIIRNQLARNHVELIEGHGQFLGPQEIEVNTGTSGNRIIKGHRIVIAVGTNATRDSHIPFDGQRIVVSDDILALTHIPRTMAVIGAGVIGVEYATMFAALGTRVTLVDKRPTLLPFLDDEISAALTYIAQQNRVTMRLGEEVSSVTAPTPENDHVEIHLKSGKSIKADVVLYAIGRSGATDQLGLDKAGVEVDERGRIAIDQHYQTSVPGVYAVGDVVGFPALASTSMEQGRLAALHALGKLDLQHRPSLLFPFGIYTVPEISMVGKSENDLTAEGIAYEIGKANYREIARGQIIGDRTGMLKLIFDPTTHKLLGVHILGEGASELIHIGQAVMAHEGTIDYFIDAVFNYPTLAECYKTAALEGINRL
jgi:NAD(P) transhydrogenase